MKNTIDIMQHSPVKSAVWKMALPTVLAMMVQIIYNLTDTLFVGMLNDTNALTALNVAFPIFMSMQLFGQVFGNGGASYTSRLMGKGKMEEAKSVTSISFWSTMFFAVIMTTLCFILMDPLLWLSGASQHTFGMSKSYLTIIALGSLFIGLQLTLSALLRAEGQTKVAMMGMLLGTIINVILDPILIFHFGMGINGAAYATIIGYGVGFIYFLYHYLNGKSLMSIKMKYFKFDLEIFMEIIKVGIPSSINLLLISFSSLFVNNVAIGYNTFDFNAGDRLIAGYGVANRLSMIIVMLVNGLAYGIQPLVGYNFGNEQFKRVKDIIYYGLKVATLISLTGATILFLFAESFVALFIQDAYTLELGIFMVKGISLSLPFIGIQLLLMVVFQSIGKGVQGSLIALGRQGIFFLPTLLILNWIFGMKGFMVSQPIGSILTTVLAILFFLSLKNELNSQHEHVKKFA